jgi:hypothetical protein
LLSAEVASIDGIWDRGMVKEEEGEREGRGGWLGSDIILLDGVGVLVTPKNLTIDIDEVKSFVVDLASIFGVEVLGAIVQLTILGHQLQIFQKQFNGGILIFGWREEERRKGGKREMRSRERGWVSWPMFSRISNKQIGLWTIVR